MASTDARPIPIKNTALRITFPIYDADGDLVTGAAGLDSEVSKDGGTFTDCTNEATEIATASGMYYLDLTSTEMNADTVAIIVKTSTSGAKTTVVVLYPQESGDVKVDLESIKTQTVTCAAGVTVGAYVGNATAAISVDASGRLDISKMGGTSLTARDIGASVLLSSGTGTGQISLASGAVTVGTNNDKTGYSLTQAFPTNFASLGINASGHVSRVTLVDTTTTNTDLVSAASIADAVWDEAISGHLTVGSTGATLADASSDAHLAYQDWINGGRLDLLLDAVKAKTDNLPASPAATGDIPSAATIATQVRTELATELGRIDVATSTRLASASYSAPPSAATISATVWADTSRTLTAFSFTVSTNDSTNVSAIKAKTDNLPASPAAAGDIPSASANASAVWGAASRTLTAFSFTVSTSDSSNITAILADTNELQTDWADGGRLDLILDARSSQASVDDLPTNSELATALAGADDATLAAIAALSIPTATENADAILSRNASNVESSAGEHTLCTVILAMLEGSVSGSTWTIKRTDGSTTHATKTVTTDAGAHPITGVN